MRLPSVQFVVTSATRTAGRFPLVLAAAVLATIAAIGKTVAGSGEETTRLLVAATLGLPLLFALTVAGERFPRGAPQRWLVPAAGIAILAAFWATWTGWSSPIQALRYFQLSVAFHLLAAFAPYTASSRPNGFWQYNRILLLRFLTAYLYAVVLFAGLGVALAAVEKLFGIHLPQQSYARLFIVIGFLFSTWFFLAGIPENLEQLDELSDYPTGLRIFSQYVLVPLVALYLTILTLYLAKVVFTRQWPSGWIGYLVSSVAVIGLLSWLLVYPLEEREEFAWVKAYTRGYLVALMPAIVMLWLAIYKRVDEYGITAPRYFLIVLSAWLAGIALWYTLMRSRNIKLIPASLCAIALLTFAGPTGAYAVSRSSQVRRLDGILARNGLLVNGRLQPGLHRISPADGKEISGALRYILGTHGAAAIAGWLPDSLMRSFGSKPVRYGAEDEAKRVMDAMGLEYVAKGASGPNEYFSFVTSNPRDAIPIDGFTFAVRMPYWNGRDSIRVGDDYVLRMSVDSTALQLSRGQGVMLSIPLQAVADSAAVWQRAHGGTVMPPSLVPAEAGNDSASARLYLWMIAGMKRPDGPKLTGFAGELFLRIKK